ncbi:hypothetical protein BJ322DRAFT_452798 [Thelephora terrestris]|uniref:SnoaL-like domain-containing protein n=1 Tax=Thelephora terrestris TaxID=56493 RepID=A0A9P6H4W0_9AGAM|nr:hypothetical protein BJ322DRAFT_452798 [Thelephora terrestris]
MSSQGTVESPQVEFIRSFVREFENKDVEKIATFLHKDLRRVTYPRSLGRSDENRDQWQHRIDEIVGLWASCTATYHSVLEAPGGKVIVHINLLSKTRFGVEMDREMLFIAHVVTDDDGSLKIKQFEEFVDSVAYREFYQAVHTAKANGLCAGSFAAA